MSDELQVSKEFLDMQLCQTMPKSKKGGPYPKQEKSSRRNEVYRYHFEYGYSARKISDLMKVGRNTINGDIKYWYSKLGDTDTIQNPESVVIITMERLDIQRSRLREYLDKTDETPSKLQIEKMICDIDCKIAHIFQRLSESTLRNYDHTVNSLNKYLESKNQDERYFTFKDKIGVSERAYGKIEKIISEDKRNNLWGRQN